MIAKFQSNISQWLSNSPKWVFAVYTSLAAFVVYTCMYSFRQPFTVGLYENMQFLGVDYKVWLVIAQVIGYTISKFLGIKYIAELKSKYRALSILVLIGISEAALFFFWLVPNPYNILFMFLNGLPLGMIWGMVFSYLEGRRLTELLGAVLCVSFVLATGFVKSVGQWIMVQFHVSEFAMPFYTGLIFVIPLILSTLLLDSVPAPTEEDVKLRTQRLPMDKSERKAFIGKFFWGIVFLVLIYIFLTIFRDLRDVFSVEIFRSIGYENDPAIFTTTQLPVALFTFLALALITFIRSNYKAFELILWTMLLSFVVVLGVTLAYQFHLVSGIFWMIAVGVGLYLGYVPFNAFLYERLISTFKYVSNVGFLIYISDAFGYLASLSIIFYKDFFETKVSWLSFFIQAGIWFSVAGIILMAFSIFYFTKKYKQIHFND